MILIADSGSTKTDWVLTDGSTLADRYQTQGINPFHQSEDDIRAILHAPAFSHLQNSTPSHLRIFFYGSGVRPELEPVMERLLHEAIPFAESVEARGDLLGAARALCGRQPGIACILGTGANSCYYDGETIVQNTPPLGYILGDEGSGAVLGKRFLNALYKGFLPQSLASDFQSETGLTMADVIARVYRQPMANRFMASLSPFISGHLDVPQLHQLIVDSFREFFRCNVAQYQRPDLPVSFVGSIAYYYQTQLGEAAEKEGFALATVLKSPLEGLIRHHCDK